jgi:hypothetical protein
LANHPSFLRIDHTDDLGNAFLSALGKIVTIYLEAEILSSDGTFKNCPRQFVQLHSLHVDLGRTSHESYIYSVMFALLPDKKERTYHCLLTLVKNWCFFWSPKILSIGYQSKSFQTPFLLAVILFGFPLSVSSHQCSILSHSSISDCILSATDSVAKKRT